MSEKPKGETDHCRHRLMRFCQGQGLDLGCGVTKITPDAIGIDTQSPYADMHFEAQSLPMYPDNHFDYIFSSHLLEEIQDTEPTLKEWLRVLKPGGNIVLYQADKELYYPLGHPNCNPRHKHRWSWSELWNIFKNIGGVKLLHHGRHPENDEWSFELVVQKAGLDMTPLKNLDGISILIPTLNRPQGVEDLALSADKTAVYPDTIEIVFGYHDDDLKTLEKVEELKKRTKIEIRGEIIDRYKDGKAHLSFFWNQCYAKSKYPICGYMGDDCQIKTPGWDEEVRRAFEKDPTIMVACNDLHVQRGRTATLFFTHKKVHEALGFYLDERFRRWYTDTYLDLIYRHAGKLHYRQDLIIEHFHPDRFPERADKTYTQMEHLKDPDIRLWGTPEIKRDIAKCIDILRGLK